MWRSLRGFRLITLTIAVAMSAPMLLPSAVFADDLKTVRMVPFVPGNTAASVPVTLLDGELPASEEFYLEVPAPGTIATRAAVEVWPDATKHCDQGPPRPSESQKQHHRLAMAVSGEGNDRVLRARVPALQIGKKFCFRASRTVGLSVVQATQIANSVSAALADAVMNSGVVPNTTDESNVLRDSLAIAFTNLHITASSEILSSDPTVIAAFHEFLAGAQFIAWKKAADDLEFKYKPDAAREQAAYEAAAKKIKNDLKPSDTALPSFTDGAGRRFTPTELLDNPSAFNPPDLVVTQARARLAAEPGETKLKDWIADFGELAAAQGRLEQAIQNVNAAASAEKTARQAASDDLTSRTRAALSQEATREAVRLSLSSLEVAYVPGTGTTPEAGSFASIDTGVMVAFVHAHQSVEPGLLPYLGVNLYLVPVDRKVPFSELVGPALLHRISLTLGATTSTVTVANRETSGAVFGRYVLLGLGIRVTEVLRLSGGAVFYNVKTANPASVSNPLRAALFVGGSLDLNVAALIGNAFVGH